MELMYRPTIFVVEDNLIYQAMIAKELESISSDIHFYTKGECCVREMYKNPSIIILDYNLDGDINGLDTLQSVRSKKPGIPAIVFSNQLGLHSKENEQRYGAFDFLEKCESSFQFLKQMISSSLKMASLG